MRLRSSRCSNGAEEGRYKSMHHPYTSPMTTIRPARERPRERPRQGVRYRAQRRGKSAAVDFVSTRRTQKRMFRALGFTDEQRYRFGFLTDAFRYAAAHGEWRTVDRLPCLTAPRAFGTLSPSRRCRTPPAETGRRLGGRQAAS